MKKLAIVLGLVLVVGCASRTKVILGPVQTAGEIQVFKTPQVVSFDLNFNRVGFTVGYLGCEIESHIGPCEKVISIEHSTGDPSKVFFE